VRIFEAGSILEIEFRQRFLHQLEVRRLVFPTLAPQRIRVQHHSQFGKLRLANVCPAKLTDLNIISKHQSFPLAVRGHQLLPAIDSNCELLLSISDCRRCRLSLNPWWLMKAFFVLPPSDRAAITSEARQKFEPVMMLWSELGEQWPVRATAAAAWLAEASSVTDLGCGTMSLERYLRPEQRYVPVDLLPRDERTLVLDLNKSLDIERLPASEACAVLGVFEYSYAPDELVAMLRRRYRQVVTTFNMLGDETLEWRIEQGWVNHFTRDEFIGLFAHRGFGATREQHVRAHENMFDFR
jgi:hypothetical protein